MRIPVTIYFIVGGMPETATKVRLIWDAEIDLISDYEGVLLPIEVKSADNTKAKSLHLFCNRYHPKLAMKTSLKNVEYFIPLFVLQKRICWENNSPTVGKISH